MNVNYELFIDEYYTLLYLFPRVNRTLFKFLPDSLSFGQLLSLEDDIKLPLDTISSKVEGSFKEVERTNSLRLIGYLRLEIALSGFLHTYLGESTKRDHLFIPSSYNLPLRHIIVKILSNVQNHNHVSDYISLTNDKEIDDYCLLMAKFDPSNLSRVISIETPEVMSENRLPSKSYVWLPRDLIKIVNPSALDLYDKVGRDERSPRKKRVTQTTTLDQFGQFPRSPTKRKSRNKSSSSLSKPAQLLLGDFFKIDQRSNDADFLIQSGNFLRSSVFQNEKFSNETPPKSPTKKRKAKVTSHNNEKESKRLQYLIQIDSDEDFTILESED